MKIHNWSTMPMDREQCKRMVEQAKTHKEFQPPSVEDMILNIKCFVTQNPNRVVFIVDYMPVIVRQKLRCYVLFIYISWLKGLPNVT